MSAASPLDIVGRYLAAVNAEDWPSLRALFAETASFRAVGSRERRGRQDVMAYFTPLFGPWRAHEDVLTRALPSGSSVTAEIRFNGTSAAGRDVTFDAVDVFDIEDGLIVSLSSWYDLVAVRDQLAD
jgi:ketosteroid isomerase-like protein